MAGKYGADSVLLMVDGYNMISNKVQAVRAKQTAEQEETTGMGDTWREHTPVGVEVAELAQEGAFFDTTALYSHAAFSGTPTTGQTPATSARTINAGFAGQTAGVACYGWNGGFMASYEVVASLGELSKINAEYSMTGQADECVIIQELATKTADWDTESAPVDNSASSASGGVGYQQVTAFSGFTGFVGTLRDSSDDITYADLITFTDVTAAPAAERLTVAGTVDRYVAFKGDVTGTGSITVFCALARN